ncbi:MAG TPA: prolipoprotein diacylglyceryl transferase [Gammaproteobacteria bacterium]|nr:prolipoprotein diacylglyceryl transferase [Gammaproteobacteria bacterium]
MLIYPEINPVAFHIGPLPVHWYGLMYLVGFLACWSVLRLRAVSRGYTQDQLADLIFYSAIGVIIGGRVGYMLFYATEDFIAHPLFLFQIWKGGMSFHGGLVGVILALWIYAYKTKKSLLSITDFIAPAVPLGLAAGRIGNFINGELWGRVTDVSWAMIFPNAGNLPRHPSQLYEFFLEGVLMFAVLWIFSKNRRPQGAVSGLFLICYGVFRFFVEFFREPDFQRGYLVFGWLTEGQLLSLPLVLLGIVLFILAYKIKIDQK